MPRRPELSEDDEPDNRPCGCPLDYHLADCPILHPPTLGMSDWNEQDYYEGDYE